MKLTIKDFKGVIPAVITIFDKNEELDEKGTREFIQHLLSYEIGGLYLVGSTGEGFLMSTEERKKYVEIVMDEVAGKVPVVVHVGAISTKISIELAKHAESVGATGISSVPPFYYKFNEEQIFSYYEDIANATSLPMIVYNIPLAGMMTVDLVKRLSEIENVKGIKYTGTTMFEMTQIKDACKEDFLIYAGCDEMAASGLGIGANGIIGSFYNMIPDLFIQIYKAAEANDLAEASKLQRNALRIIMNLLEHGSLMAALKACLRHSGISAGYARKPFNNFTQDEELKIVDSLLALAKEYDMKNIGIIDRLR